MDHPATSWSVSPGYSHRGANSHWPIRHDSNPAIASIGQFDLECLPLNLNLTGAGGWHTIVSSRLMFKFHPDKQVSEYASHAGIVSG